jgi:hypothetical protein
MRRSWFVPLVLALLAVLVGPAASATTAAGWVIQPSPNPDGATASVLSAVSCASDGTCMAVGNYNGNGRGSLPFSERWDGSTWSIVTMPGVEETLPVSVSCPDPSLCIAVGYSVVGSVVATVSEEWDGSVWTTLTTPAPAPWTELTGVSCSSTTHCTAVGGEIPSGVDSQEQPLAMTWNGTVWTIVPTPNPHAENGSALTGVSCASADSCEATGIYAYADVDQLFFALRWDGLTWSVQRQPNPKGNFLNAENGVSCSTTTICKSAGTWQDISGRIRGLAESWDGSAWTPDKVPHPVGFGTMNLDAISCASATSCATVGDWSTSASGVPSLTFAEGWDGTGWRIQPTETPSGALLASLNGVSCLSATSCVAVGSWYANGVTQTLIESFSG